MDDQNYPRILCVDDDRDILDAIAPHLHPSYLVELATSGAEGLRLLRQYPDIAVIVSDLRMPGMDGSKFLAASRALAPDARRILLTGCDDMSAAIAAVNDGQICRFLTKPCAPRTFLAGIEFALSEYRSEMANRSAIRQFTARHVLGEDRVTGLASRERLLETLGSLIDERNLGREAVGTVYLLHIHFVPPFAENVDSAAVDEWIRAIAEQLTRKALGANCIARWDKNVFAVFDDLPASAPEALYRRGQDLADSATSSWEIGSVYVTTEISVGIVAIAAGMIEPQVVMRHAELAEQEARGNSGAKVALYTAETGAKAEYQRDVIRSLRKAITDGELELHYQPIVDINTHTVHSVEALARWSHPRYGKIPPTVFIPLAEAAGLIISLGAWVLRQACSDARALLDLGFPRIALNVSIMQLLDTGFLYSLYIALEDSGLPPAALEIEVTESVFAQDLDRVRSILLDIRKLGVCVAIDDFGTGYSSLSYLNQLPVNLVKIDGAFIRDFERGGEAILGATIDVAHKLHLETIVEGVETPTMLAQARSVGAILIQGYHFARPMPLAALAEWHAGFARESSEQSTQAVAMRAS
ncbi:MAG: EAL domain-containing protein [Steroidobacteraceae bacterium]